MEAVKAYKGFDKNLQCNPTGQEPFQYEIGKEYEIGGDVEVCERGFHACEAPLNVLRFYGLNNGNRYCEVIQSGELSKDNDGTKIASSKIKIGAEIGLPGLIKAHFEYTRKKAESGEKGGDSSNLAGGDGSNLAGGNDSNLAGGNWSNLAGGNSSLLVVRNGKAKGGLNSVIVLTAWKWENGAYTPSSVTTIIIDGEQYKPNTWYTLKDGEIVEAEE